MYTDIVVIFKTSMGISTIVFEDLYELIDWQLQFPGTFRDSSGKSTILKIW